MKTKTTTTTLWELFGNAQTREIYVLQSEYSSDLWLLLTGAGRCQAIYSHIVNTRFGPTERGIFLSCCC